MVSLIWLLHSIQHNSGSHLLVEMFGPINRTKYGQLMNNATFLEVERTKDRRYTPRAKYLATKYL